MAEDSNSLLFTPTWVVAAVCFIIVLLSLFAQRGLHKLGKFLKHTEQDALFEALQKLKEELMLLGFISLLLTVSQGAISRICVPSHIVNTMLPCKRETKSESSSAHGKYFLSRNQRRKLLSSSANEQVCAGEGKSPLLSVEALHQLHIFIFVLAVVHVIFCATTMVLGGARIRQWKAWEESIRNISKPGKVPTKKRREHHEQLRQFVDKHAKGHWKKSAVVSWLMSFFKQFYGSITMLDYIALRQGFIMTHCPNVPDFDFHKYMLRTLEIDFKRIVGISWFLWLFVVFFLLLNIEGWHTYFWLAFLPLVLLLLVGAKLELIIKRLAQEVAEKKSANETTPVEPSDKHFWFHNPALVLRLIHFILFQNSFEIAFFFWIWVTYGLESCIMEKLGYIIPRLIMGVIVQVLCSYSTLPLYALVSQMGTKFKKGMIDEFVESAIRSLLNGHRNRRTSDALVSHTPQLEMVAIEGRRNATTSSATLHNITDSYSSNETPIP